MASETSPLLEVKNLKVYFPVFRGLLRRKYADVKAVDDISFHVMPGETLGVVGESGCGKSTVGRGILRLIEPTAGEVSFEGNDLLSLSPEEMRLARRKMALMFQDPFASLDPRQTAGSTVAEPLAIHNIGSSGSDREDRVAELLRRVGLDPSMSNRVPHEFSGGQRQRIGIARALASNPSLVVCDEPISALDVSIQAQIINLMKELQDGMDGLTYVFIAHDLSVVRYISDRVAVMYLGHIVEITDSDRLYDNPLHPYTQALLSAVPIPDPEIEENRDIMLLEGEVPSPLHPPRGCPFHPRCPRAIAECKEIQPELRDVEDGHAVACIRVDEGAP